MSDQILEITDLTVSFDGFRALNNLNFHMSPGELRVIIGPNGAGKTTFLDVITGKVQPTTGSVRFQGQDLSKLSEDAIARKGIGRKFQTPRVYLNLTVKENLDLACVQTKTVWSTLFGKASSAEKRNVAGLLETIGLTSKAELPADLLSHGEKQRLEIGMLVAQSPELLLVDEPVAGLTDEETENVGNLLIALAESHSIIVIEHDMEFVRQIARQVTVLHQGSVLCEGTMDEVQNDPRVIEVYLGEKPSISAHQIKLLRVVANIAWSDGNLAAEELEVITERMSKVLARSEEEREFLRYELQDYLNRDIEIEGLISELSENEKRLAAKLSYEIILAHGESPATNPVNEAEARAYQRLVKLLELTPGVVEQLEAEVKAEVS
ncbi:MAG: urea ABC transporter ATP-binding protein UrtD [Cyanobacteria bacterium P01_H01_bin.15]